MIMSSLLAKYRYTAPADMPASVKISCIEVAWKPLRTKHTARGLQDVLPPAGAVLSGNLRHQISSKGNDRSP